MSNATEFHAHAAIDKDGDTSPFPSGNELGQMMFTDALSALKLHMTAKLMADGHIPRGPIVDFEGSDHLSGKSFFMRYPLYAAEIVLRNLHELMAGYANRTHLSLLFGIINIILRTNEENAAKFAKKLFSNPDWQKAFKEIIKLAFFRVVHDPEGTVELTGTPEAAGKKQMEMVKVPVDFGKIYRDSIKKSLPDFK